MRNAEFLLLDISNTFAKWALATRTRIGPVKKWPTSNLSVRVLREVLTDSSALRVVVSSVVPAATKRIARALPRETIFVGPKTCGGLKIDYPAPEHIGADRLANALACIEIFGAPSIVVDFGTAVTFDVISGQSAYVGGVIAPGLNLMADYLHSRTALLPHISLTRPLRAVGKSTRGAMLSGAVYGYRGLVAEILRRVSEEEFPDQAVTVVATGGDAKLIGETLELFDHIDPQLTLKGLQLIAQKHFPPPRAPRRPGTHKQKEEQKK